MGALMPDGSVISELYLGHRGIRALSPGVFDDMGGITYLYLSGNELTTLPSGIFDSLTALEGLSLDNNKLEGLSAALFAGLPLYELYLFCYDETNGPGQSCGADDNPNIACAPFTAAQFYSLYSSGYSGPSERCCAEGGDAYATDGASCVCSPVRAGGSGLVSHGALTPAPCPPAPACACLLIQMHAFIYIPRCVCFSANVLVCLISLSISLCMCTCITCLFYIHVSVDLSL